jgi:hypothetical protein
MEQEYTKELANAIEIVITLTGFVKDAQALTSRKYLL